VPANIAVPAGNKLFLIGHAVGTQNYICLPMGASSSPSLHHRPPSSRGISRSPPTTSAPTRLRVAQCGRRGNIPKTPAPSGAGWWTAIPPLIRPM
jgi:hypothetical protein